jgi:short-subunit dehydrogenase
MRQLVSLLNADIKCSEVSDDGKTPKKCGAKWAVGSPPLLFDLQDEAMIANAAVTVRQALDGYRLAGLVNNAGMGFGGSLALQPIEEVR